MAAAAQDSQLLWLKILKCASGNPIELFALDNFRALTPGTGDCHKWQPTDRRRREQERSARRASELPRRWNGPAGRVLVQPVGLTLTSSGALPCENVVTTDSIGANGVSNLVAIACVAEEEETVEWHIKLPKVSVGSERKVVGNDAFERPDETRPILASDVVGLGKKLQQLGGELDLQAVLGSGNGIRSSW